MDRESTQKQALLAEEQIYARQAIRNHPLVVGHSTNLPPRLIATITQLHIEERHVVHIEHRSGLTSTTVRRVVDGSLHAGFGILPVRAPELLIRTIYVEPLVACIPTGHRLVVKPTVSPQDFDGEPIIAVSREAWPERHQEIEDHCAGFGVSLNVVADAYSAPEALTYVEQKTGICLLPGTSVAGRPGTFGQLCDRYLKEGVPERHTTASALRSMVKYRIRPYWYQERVSYPWSERKRHWNN